MPCASLCADELLPPSTTSGTNWSPPVFRPSSSTSPSKCAGECIAYNLIRQAKSLLLTTTLPVQQIADRLGFRNQSHFGTFFRREVGAGPKAFREKGGSFLPS